MENKRKNVRIFRNIRSDVASIKQKQDKRCACHNSLATCLHQPPTSVNTTIIHPISQSQKVESDPLFFSSPYASSSKLRVDSDLSFLIMSSLDCLNSFITVPSDSRSKPFQITPSDLLIPNQPASTSILPSHHQVLSGYLE